MVSKTKPLDLLAIVTLVPVPPAVFLVVHVRALIAHENGFVTACGGALAFARPVSLSASLLLPLLICSFVPSSNRVAAASAAESAGAQPDRVSNASAEDISEAECARGGRWAGFDPSKDCDGGWAVDGSLSEHSRCSNYTPYRKERKTPLVSCCCQHTHFNL